MNAAETNGMGPILETEAIAPFSILNYRAYPVFCPQLRRIPQTTTDKPAMYPPLATAVLGRGTEVANKLA